jgi:hypothetical protein
MWLLGGLGVHTWFVLWDYWTAEFMWLASISANKDNKDYFDENKYVNICEALKQYLTYNKCF